MKKILIVFALLIIAAPFLNAQTTTPPAAGQGGGGGQGGGTPEQRAQRYIDGQAIAGLNLTTDQKTKVLAILTEQNKSLDALTAAIPQTATDRQAQIAALQPKILAIMTSNEQIFIALLTDAQKLAYRTIAQARPATTGFGQQGGRGGGGGGGGQQAATPEVRAQRAIDTWAFESLNLTADQKTKTQAILIEQNKSLDAITATITIPQGTSQADRQAQMTALRPKMLPVMQDNEKKFIALLKQDQKKAYEEIVKIRGTRGFGETTGGIPVGAMTKNPDAHDPVMAKEGDTYYVFYTNGGISQWSSKDLVNWKREAQVFTTMPAWIPDQVPGFNGVGFWAPDITFHNGQWYLYYAASTFGSQNSAIGVATNKTLNPASPDFKWVDQGKVIQSIRGRDNWNAIDANLAFDETGVPWLNFGSFWGGIKMVKLNPDLKTITKPEAWSTIAGRAGTATAIEGSFIFKKDKYYYLFVSWDRCCAGTSSTYNIRVGRSEKITGPYLDKDGVDMTKGGGTLVLGGDTGTTKVVYALGHNSAYTFDGSDYLVYHKYVQEGSRLGVDKLAWDNGWPVVPPKAVATK